MPPTATSSTSPRHRPAPTRPAIDTESPSPSRVALSDSPLLLCERRGRALNSLPFPLTSRWGVGGQGAPHVILNMCANKDEIRSSVEKTVHDLGTRGIRSLAVGRKDGEDGPWRMLGILTFLDPPRPDTKQARPPPRSRAPGRRRSPVAPAVACARLT